jgi:excisionase family DNA binding protein
LCFVRFVCFVRCVYFVVTTVVKTDGLSRMYSNEPHASPPAQDDMLLARNACTRLRAAAAGGRPIRFTVLTAAAPPAKGGGRAGDTKGARARVRRSRGGEAGTVQSVEIPGTAAALLINLLGHLAEGQAVTVVPVKSELTTQEAAEILGVSRPFVVKEIEENRLPARKVGVRRRVMYGDLMAYKQRADAERQRALDQVAALDRELGLT